MNFKYDKNEGPIIRGLTFSLEAKGYQVNGDCTYDFFFKTLEQDGLLFEKELIGFIYLKSAE